eukprot:GHVL01012922.1.p1 GENE.GHVL01012922.1~~GHVL01012922.1.p1  ORF type:complete len:656 (+),score=155.04 GHVL01012922.1:259-1968(+)
MNSSDAQLKNKIKSFLLEISKSHLISYMPKIHSGKHVVKFLVALSDIWGTEEVAIKYSRYLLELDKLIVRDVAESMMILSRLSKRNIDMNNLYIAMNESIEKLLNNSFILTSSILDIDMILHSIVTIDKDLIYKEYFEKIINICRDENLWILKKIRRSDNKETLCHLLFSVTKGLNIYQNINNIHIMDFLNLLYIKLDKYTILNMDNIQQLSLMLTCMTLLKKNDIIKDTINRILYLKNIKKINILDFLNIANSLMPYNEIDDFLMCYRSNYIFIKNEKIGLFIKILKIYNNKNLVSIDMINDLKKRMKNEVHLFTPIEISSLASCLPLNTPEQISENEQNEILSDLIYHTFHNVMYNNSLYIDIYIQLLYAASRLRIINTQLIKYIIKNKNIIPDKSAAEVIHALGTLDVYSRDSSIHILKDNSCISGHHCIRALAIYEYEYLIFPKKSYIYSQWWDILIKSAESGLLMNSRIFPGILYLWSCIRNYISNSNIPYFTLNELKNIYYALNCTHIKDIHIQNVTDTQNVTDIQNVTDFQLNVTDTVKNIHKNILVEECVLNFYQIDLILI